VDEAAGEQGGIEQVTIVVDTNLAARPGEDRPPAGHGEEPDRAQRSDQKADSRQRPEDTGDDEEDVNWDVFQGLAPGRASRPGDLERPRGHSLTLAPESPDVEGHHRDHEQE